jgi:hypothetical protein
MVVGVRNTMDLFRMRFFFVAEGLDQDSERPQSMNEVIRSLHQTFATDFGCESRKKLDSSPTRDSKLPQQIIVLSAPCVLREILRHSSTAFDLENGEAMKKVTT